jgi:hypothetical protein
MHDCEIGEPRLQAPRVQPASQTAGAFPVPVEQVEQWKLHERLSDRVGVRGAPARYAMSERLATSMEASV